MIINKKIIFAAGGLIFAASVILNVWLSYQLVTAAKSYEASQMDLKILAFTDMFVEDVLMADKEIDFDTRLALETAVRALDDQEIFDQWKIFTKAATKEDASTQVKIFLDLLVKKMK